MARTARPEAEKKADAALGKRLSAIRKDRGFTQVELADKVGVPQAVISNYERGKLRIHPTMLTKLATLLGVSSDELLGLAPPQKIMPLNRRFLRRLQAIDALPKRDQEALLRTIDTFLDRHRLSRHQAAS